MVGDTLGEKLDRLVGLLLGRCVLVELGSNESVSLGTDVGAYDEDGSLLSKVVGKMLGL